MQQGGTAQGTGDAGHRPATAFSIDELKTVREARRGKAMIARLHHHAIRTDDMETTRIFYEELLGMPMVSALKEMIDPTTGAANPYLHCFFEMRDGSCIAFFQFLGRDAAPKTPQDVFDHHLAILVPDFADLKTIKARLEAAGHATAGIDHGFCYSLYVRDPNGMALELVGDPENELEINEAYARSAHEEYRGWLDKQYVANNEGRNNGVFPMEPSSYEDLMKVLPADRG